MTTIDKIDLVVPYVDGNDPEWIKVFNQHSPRKIDENVNGKTRFRGQGNFLKYLFRGIDKFMPWINSVYLLVQSESQVPDWINKDKVKVITHDKFIPEKFLPTFNSCTIEMFLWNVPGLSDKFIYINDDFYAINNMEPTDFFTVTGVKQKIKLTGNMSIYGKQCQNCHALIYGDRPERYRTIKHSFRPYIKSMMKACFKEKQQAIEASITRFRDDKNYNCYIYSLYQDKKQKRADSALKELYLSAGQTTMLNRETINMRLKGDMLCINDNDPAIDVYSNSLLNKWFSEEFPIKCKYEKDGKPYANRKRKHDINAKQSYFLYF